MTSRTRIDTDFHSDEHSEFFGRPVTESVTARAGSDTNLASDEHSEFFDRPVTESVMSRTGSDTDFLRSRNKPEVIQTFPMGNTHNLSTDRSRSR